MALEPGATALLDEIARQIQVLSHSSSPPWASERADNVVLDLVKQGIDYEKSLHRLQSKISGISLHLLQSRWSDIELDHELAWKIPAFCEPSWFVDPDLAKSRSKILLSLRPNTSEEISGSISQFWEDARIIKWASMEDSALLILQGSPTRSFIIEQVSVDLVEYLEENDRKVVWVFNVLSGGGSDRLLGQWTTISILKQITVQIIRKNRTFNSLRRVATIVELMKKAISDADWFNIVEYALEGLTEVYLVVDLGVLGSNYGPSMSWPAHCTRLFSTLARHSPRIILKVFLLVCRSIPREIELHGTSVVPIHDTTPQNSGSIKLSKEKGSKINLPLFRLQVDDIEMSSSRGMEWEIPDPSPSNIGGVAAQGSGWFQSPKNWFQELDAFEQCVDACRKEADKAHPRVKIAILDTGLDITHPDIYKEYIDRRIETYDFLDKSASIKDLDGHGTHCTSILARLAPNAQIYVGRVFRTNKAEESTGILTKAIAHAANVWKVDIISMSLGFTEADDSMQSEIRKAIANNVLVFAAAANNTTNERTPVRFPARMRDVISVFSSDSYGYRSKFNPPARFDRPNFMFPGENIEGAWPSTANSEGTFNRGNCVYKYQNGTSCATPIATAIAAGILEYAWQERAHRIRRVGVLKHYTGMSEIFAKRMVDQYRVGDGRYHYVKPWKLLSIYRPRDEIPIHISDTMDHIDG